MNTFHVILVIIQKKIDNSVQKNRHRPLSYNNMYVFGNEKNIFLQQ